MLLSIGFSPHKSVYGAMTVAKTWGYLSCFLGRTWAKYREVYDRIPCVRFRCLRASPDQRCMKRNKLCRDMKYIELYFVWSPPSSIVHKAVFCLFCVDDLSAKRRSKPWNRNFLEFLMFIEHFCALAIHATSQYLRTYFQRPTWAISRLLTQRFAAW